MKCKIHNVSLIDAPEVIDGKVIVCPVDGCDVGINKFDGISIFLGSKKADDFNIIQNE